METKLESHSASVRQSPHQSAFSLSCVLGNSLQTELTIIFAFKVTFYTHVELNCMTNNAGKLCRKQPVDVVGLFLQLMPLAAVTGEECRQRLNEVVVHISIGLKAFIGHLKQKKKPLNYIFCSCSVGRHQHRDTC